MKTFEELKNTNYFRVLADDMKVVLEANEIIWENINARNFYDVFTRFYQDSAICEDFKTYNKRAPLCTLLHILSDADEVINAVQQMNPTNLKTLSVYDLDNIIRSTLFGEVLMYVLEENMEK